jgi:threonine/homoserine/homoserine lactone efflux protein
MWTAVAQKLPDAIGIALSAMPIAGLLVMLTAAQVGRAKALAYALGWMFALSGAVTLTTLASQAVTQALGGGTVIWVGGLEILLGVIQLYLGFITIRRRPKNPSEVEEPRWMKAVDRMSLSSAFLFGALMIVTNGKNLTLSIAAGASFVRAKLSYGQLAAAIAVFTLIGSITILGPVLLTLLVPKRSASFLVVAREWLIANNVIILTLVFWIVGAIILVSGLVTLGL